MTREPQTPGTECGHLEVVRWTADGGVPRLWSCFDCRRRFYPSGRPCADGFHAETCPACGLTVDQRDDPAWATAAAMNYGQGFRDGAASPRHGPDAGEGPGLDVERLARAMDRVLDVLSASADTTVLWAEGPGGRPLGYSTTALATDIAAAYAAAAASEEAAPAAPERPCSGCGGRRWADDENWQPSDPRSWDGTRREADGLIPCGFCNEGGWDTPAAPAAPVSETE